MKTSSLVDTFCFVVLTVIHTAFFLFIVVDVLWQYL